MIQLLHRPHTAGIRRQLYDQSAAKECLDVRGGGGNLIRCVTITREITHLICSVVARARTNVFVCLRLLSESWDVLVDLYLELGCNLVALDHGNNLLLLLVNIRGAGS